MVVLCIFQSTHSRGVRLPYIRCNLALIQYFNPRTHEECDRPPMLAFAFVEELFKFQYDSPSFEPLFQLPPTCASTHFKTLMIQAPKEAGEKSPGPP